MKLKVGDQAKWTSQAGGATREKNGRVLAVISAGDSIKMVLRRLKLEALRRDIKADADTSMFDRYLIEVMVDRKRGGPKPVLYVPKVSVVDAQVTPAPIVRPAQQESLFASEAT